MFFADLFWRDGDDLMKAKPRPQRNHPDAADGVILVRAVKMGF